MSPMVPLTIATRRGPLRAGTLPIQVTFQKPQKKKAPKLTARQLEAAISAITAMLAGEGPGAGDWPEKITHRDMEGALAKLQDQFSRLSAKELLKITHGDLFEDGRAR